jgi:hypothetical protein
MKGDDAIARPKKDLLLGKILKEQDGEVPSEVRPRVIA